MPFDRARRYADGTKEYHDLASDPDKRRNTFAALSSAEQAALSAALAAVEGCEGAASCWAAERPKAGRLGGIAQ